MSFKGKQNLEDNLINKENAIGYNVVFRFYLVIRKKKPYISVRL